MNLVGQTFEFPASLTWLDRPPLRVASGLGGHVVLVLLWRLGCVHSRDALAEAARIVAQFAGRPVALVAVHVPIAAGERDEARLRRTLQLLDVEATVAVDGDHELMRWLGCTRLPALLLLDASGCVRAQGIGVAHRRRLADALTLLVDEAVHGGRGASTQHVPCAAAKPLLLAPTAIVRDGERLWIAAAAARRVLAIEGTRVVQVVGGGAFGSDDGAATRASFRLPAALCVHDGRTFVLDCLAHSLRAIEANGDVATWCGNGRRSTDRVGGAYGTDQGLFAPMAVCMHDGALLLAQAGAHQLWQFDPATRAATAWLGSGDRGGIDGTAPTFAEPSAVLVHEATLWVADAGNDSVRAVDLAHLQVRTVHRALPRPTALLWHRDDLLVAASWQPAVLRCAGGEGAPQLLFGAADGLVEPVAMACDQDCLWIADLGADCVFVADLAASPPTLQRVAIGELPPRIAADAATFAQLLSPVQMAEHSDVRLVVPLLVGAGECVIEGSSCHVEVVDEAAPVLACARSTDVPVVDRGAGFLLPVAAAGRGSLRLVLRCEVLAGAARRERTWRYVLPVEVVAGGPLSVQLNCERT